VNGPPGRRSRGPQDPGTDITIDTHIVSDADDRGQRRGATGRRVGQFGGNGKKRVDPAYDPALPPYAIDMIRDGVPRAAFRSAGPFALHTALNRIALSLQARGGTYERYTELILGDGSKLGFQLHNPPGKKPLTRASAYRELRRVWKGAERFRDENPAEWHRDELVAEALRRADAAQCLATDADNDLTDTERAVLAYTAEVTRIRKLTRVPLPWRDVAEVTGLGPQATRATLARLTKRGLHLDIHGRANAHGGKRRANLYSLRIPSIDTATHPLAGVAYPDAPSIDTTRDPNPSIDPSYGSVYGGDRPVAHPDDIIITLGSGTVIRLPAGSTLDEITAAIARLQLQGDDLPVPEFRSDGPLPENVKRLRVRKREPA
jgi:hypothetical protein